MDTRRFEQRLGQHLRARRLEMQRTQADVAEHLGLTRSSVSNIEAGNQGLSLTLFMQFAHYLDLRPGALLDVVAAEDEDSRADLPDLPDKYWALVNSFVATSRASSVKG